jgi:hypothetical protein
MTHRSFAGCALLLGVAIMGCGAKGGQVSGKVTFQGKPLTSGTVLFHCADGSVAHALLASDGSYAIPNVPPGEAKITVKSHGPVPLGMIRGASKAPGGKPPPKELPAALKFVPIPAAYGDPAQSGLALVVQGGSQRHDIALGR